jgi:hypothetical protein
MILSLRRLVWLSEGHEVSYLKPILELNTGHTSVYSLNYDNAVERLCQQNRYSYSVGITEEGGVEFDHTSSVHLMKLHGSIDWLETRQYRDPRTGRYPALPLPGIQVATEREMSKAEDIEFPAIIFGQGNKLKVDGPYLELLRQFRDDLERHDHLVAVGYSFRDEHINHYVLRWMTGDHDRRITIINGPSFSERVREIPVVEDLVRHMGARVKILGEYAGSGLQRISPS